MIFQTILIALLVVAVSVIGYRFITGIWPGSRVIIQEPPENVPQVSDKNANFMIFYTEWCPYSQKAMEEWKSFKQMMTNSPKTYGGKTITFEEIDADASKGRAAIYQVREYPTLKLQTKEKLYTMLGKPTPASFKAFLVAALGKESS